MVVQDGSSNSSILGLTPIRGDLLYYGSMELTKRRFGNSPFKFDFNVQTNVLSFDVDSYLQTFFVNYLYFVSNADCSNDTFWIAANNNCSTCPNGTFYSSAGENCLYCNAYMVECVTCSSMTVCTSCDSGFWLSSSNICVGCSSWHANCTACNQSGCSACNLPYVSNGTYCQLCN